MAKLSLKNIIGKKYAAFAIIQSLVDQLKANISIEDENGKILAGNEQTAPEHQYPIAVDNELLGWVRGDNNAFILSNLLTVLLQKEGEKKNLGREVLNLYQEVNLIFNF